MTVRLGFLGVAHAHPAIDAANLRALGVELIGVADDDPARRRDFAERFGVPEVTITELVALAPDAVIVTARTALVAELLPAVLGIVPTVFVNKVAAATPGHLAALDALGSGFGTATPLAFAPAVRALARDVRDRRILGVRVLAHHDAAPFRSPGREWQDDATDGGGTLLSVGSHAWQLVDAVLPGASLVAIHGELAWRHAGTSEDLAQATAQVRHGGSDVPVQLTVSGLAGDDRYEVEVFTEAGIHSAVLTDAAQFGFAELAEAVAAAARCGETPYPWTTSRAAATNAVTAARLLRATSSRAERPHD
jgi:predicted dehydrogenase